MSLVNQVLCNLNYVDIPLMAAFCKQVIHLLGQGVDQQIVQDYEARSATGVLKTLPVHRS